MNSPTIPEIHWKYAYTAILMAIVLGAVALYRLVGRSGWLEITAANCFWPGR
jgi:Mg2+ and Co2+ transporter CorA